MLTRLMKRLARSRWGRRGRNTLRQFLERLTSRAARDSRDFHSSQRGDYYFPVAELVPARILRGHPGRSRG
jgi:hypothetical protein